MRSLALTLILALTIVLDALAIAPVRAQQTSMIEQLGDDRQSQLHALAVFAPPEVRRAALAEILDTVDMSAIPALLLALRYRQDGQADTILAFQQLSGSAAETWFDGALWQQAHPEIAAHPSYRIIKLALLERVDPGFLRFLGGERGMAGNLDIRLEEVVWGGVGVDGIPSLDTPAMVDAGGEEAAYLLDDDLVFGVAINGDVRAYPLRVLGWHEMMNDVVGGVPVALAYCTLCGSGILYETRAEGRTAPFVFGSSGLLYRSNKLMFDRETDSLWNQFTGAPVSGPLRGGGIRLKTRPITIARWGDWRAAHPHSRVLSRETGFRRNYEPGVVYRDYFASPDLMFPVLTDGATGLADKDYVFGIRTAGGAKAWPLAAFEKDRVINDTVGLDAVVLVGEAAGRTVRAYRRERRTFAATADPMRLSDRDGEWRVTEDALVGPGDETLARMPGQVSYWFAWNSYLGAESSLYGVSD